MVESFNIGLTEHMWLTFINKIYFCRKFFMIMTVVRKQVAYINGLLFSAYGRQLSDYASQNSWPSERTVLRCTEQI